MPAPAPLRPRRSVLYVPGANARALSRATALPVDGLILDLEDAVLPEAKVTAREAVIRAIAGRGFGPREVVVRINGLDTPWGTDDFSAAATSGADAILLPKVDGPGAVTEALSLAERCRAPGNLQLWVMAETPRGLLAIEQIAAASPRLTVIVMGTADLGTALRIPEGPSRAGLLPALSRCVVAARAAGLDILDGIFADLANPDGFRAACLEGRSLGFDGKTLIHPGQLETANEIFGVSDAEAAAAAELITAWESAAAGGSGVAVVAGRMVERLHADAARRQLALYRLIQDRSG